MEELALGSLACTRHHLDVRWCVRMWFSWPIVSGPLNNHYTITVKSSLPKSGNGLGYEMEIHAHAGTHQQGAV